MLNKIMDKKRENITIPYKIEEAKIKNIYIRVKDGQVMVRCSPRVSKEYIEEVIYKKSAWINKKLAEYEKEKQAGNLEKMEILGNEYNVKIQYKQINKIDINVTDEVEISLPTQFENEEISTQLKTRIKDAIYKKVVFEETKLAMQKYGILTGLNPEKWRIRKINTAWGSCSSNKNITISSNLAKFDRQTIEYVVLHELTHLKYMNHSKEFWKMVESYMPNYKQIRKQLK